MKQFNNLTIELLNIKINAVTLSQAVSQVEFWLKSRGKHYIVTPNPEMLVDARMNSAFKQALNEADLAIPDSARLAWAKLMIQSKNPFLRLFYFPFFLFPRFLPGNNLPTTSGVDLMESLIKLSEKRGFRTAYLGASKRSADKLLECLRGRFPKLKIIFVSGDIKVEINGNMQFDSQSSKLTQSKQIKSSPPLNAHSLSQKIDILFVAFGHIKQEIWMQKNLPKLNARVMVGVGGAFDYLSGTVPRAPRSMRELGLEWLFRGLVQPWRIKRFWKLLYFVYMLVTSK